MKIIGRTGGSGYIVEATENELALCAGFTSDYDDGWKKMRPAARPNGWEATSLAIGAMILPVIAPYMSRLRDNEAKAKASAEMLRTLADMITLHLPTTIIPPSEEQADEGCA
jgi:hypothetical protein